MGVANARATWARFGWGGRLAYAAAAWAGVDCAIAYYATGIENLYSISPRASAVRSSSISPGTTRTCRRRRLHGSGRLFVGSPDVAIHLYAGLSPGFAGSTNADFDKPAARLAHSRSIALLGAVMGRYYDLEGLWEQHTLYEFGTRDAAATMQTMVAEPYVNHIPVMTGGVGGEEPARFYAHISSRDARLTSS